jgi:fucose 4-O-acetylase-like acetyltransferase
MLGKRVVGLLVPYLVWIGVSYLSSGGRTLAALPSFYRQRVLYPQSPGAAWFLLALFECFVVFAAVRAAGGRDWMVVASAVLVGGIVVLPVPGGDVLGILDVAWIYPFFAMGYLFAKHAERLAERRVALMIGGGLAWAVLVPVLWPVLVNDANWWYPTLREWLHANHLLGGVAVVYAARYACAAGAICALFYLYDYVRGKALSVQAWIGKRTLGMYLIQPYVLALASAYLTRNWVALTAIAFVGSLLGAWLLEHNRVTRLVFLGQRSRVRLPA